MSGALRIVRAIIKWFAILGGATLLVVVLVNSRDEELTSEARSLAEFQRLSLPDAQNAYLALIGFDAPAGADPIAAGARIVTEHDAAASHDPLATERGAKATGEEPAHDETRLKFVEATNRIYDPLDRPSLPQALERAHDIGAMTDANAELVARYLAMQKLPAFANTSIPDILQPMPSGGWSGPWRLLLMQSALDAQTGQVTRALAFLAADIRMWRRILGSGGGLIDEMIAVRGLAADYRLLSDLIAAPTFDVSANKVAMRDMLAPFGPADLNLAPMFKREFEMQARLMAALPEEAAKEPEGWIDRLMNGSALFPVFFKLNASLNRSARLFSSIQLLASHPPSDFTRLRDEVQGEMRDMSETGITWFYNPIGKTLVGVAVPAYQDYVARVFDLAAYEQLVRAQLELRLARVASGQVTAFLNNAGPETRNPYTEQPFQLNAPANNLSFEPMAGRWREWGTKVAVPPPL